MLNVTEEAVSIPMPGGKAAGYFYYPADTVRAPGVLHLTDIFGVRESNRGMARRLAGQGYAVLVPDVFYRDTRPVGDIPALRRDRDVFTTWMNVRTGPLTGAAQEHDASALVDWLGTRDQFRAGHMAVVGHCWTGGMAVRAAAARHGTIVAAASFHGGNLCTDKPDSPHLSLPRVKAELYFGHAENDHSMPGEAIDRLDTALKGWGGVYASKVYPAAHGWTVPDNPAFNEEQAEDAYWTLLALLKRALP
jgi:carboxymethylenebutenolidase